MLFSRQQLRVFTLLTVSVALAQASWFNSNPFRREVVEKKDLLGGINSAVDGLLGTAAASTTPGTTASPTESSAPTTISSSTPTPTPTTSTSTPAQKTTSTSTPADDTTTTSDTPTPTPSTPTQSDNNNSQSVATLTQVVPGGASPTKDSTSSKTSSSSTSSSTATLGQDQASSSTTMSAKTKTTVIGVVVGVGGAIVLAGLFVVAWRIWGRKKNEDESDGLMGFRSGSAGHEKSNSASGGGAPNPFQSTLENYHNPSKNVNASSNF